MHIRKNSKVLILAISSNNSQNSKTNSRPWLEVKLKNKQCLSINSSNGSGRPVGKRSRLKHRTWTTFKLTTKPGRLRPTEEEPVPESTSSTIASSRHKKSSNTRQLVTTQSGLHRDTKTHLRTLDSTCPRKSNLSLRTKTAKTNLRSGSSKPQGSKKPYKSRTRSFLTQCL